MLLVIAGIAIIDAGAKRPVNWSRTFDIRDKIPYGLFVLRTELPNILGKERTYKDYGETIYEIVSVFDSLNTYDASLIEISPFGYMDEGDTKKLISFVKNGGEVFLSTDDGFGESLLDTLGIETEQLRYRVFYPTDKNITYSLGNSPDRVKFDKVQQFWVFSKLNAETCTIMGNLHSRGRAIPNFIKVSLGKGHLYLHTLPEVFANYHMLQEEERYHYAATALNVLNNEKVWFYDSYFEWEKPKTPLRVILTQPGFNQAWYLLLVALLLLLVFKSKREQRAVKVVLPEPNLSKEFAKTIGNLYYENGTPDNIVLKKIEYFLFAIRSWYQLDTLDIMNDKFIKQLSLKSAVDIEQTRSLMEMIEKYRQSKDFTLDDVKIVNHYIEDFKQKANII